MTPTTPSDPDPVGHHASHERGGSDPMATDPFSAQVGALTDGIAKLRESMVDERTARRRTDRRRSVLNVIMLCLLAAVLVAVLKLYDVATTSEAARKNGRQTLTQVLDCTTPSTPTEKHECADRGAAQTAAAVLSIVDTNGNGIPDISELAAATGHPLTTTTTTTLGGNR